MNDTLLDKIRKEAEEMQDMGQSEMTCVGEYAISVLESSADEEDALGILVGSIEGVRDECTAFLKKIEKRKGKAKP